MSGGRPASQTSWAPAERVRWETGHPTDWTRAFARSVAQAVGQWRRFSRTPVGVATPLPDADALDVWQAALDARCGPKTVVTYLEWLRMGLAVLYPDADLADLRTRCMVLRGERFGRQQAPVPPVARTASSRRLAVPADAWPDDLATAWQSAVIAARGRRFSRHRSAASGWSAAYVRKVEVAVGRFVATCREADIAVAPTRTALEAFIDQLEDRGVSRISISIYLGDLLAGFRLLTPTADLSALRQCALRAKSKSRGKDKVARVVDSTELKAAGLALVREAQGMLRGKHAALRARNGVLLAFLSMRPVRVRNVAETELAVSLLDQEDGTFRVHYADTKNGRVYDAPLDREVSKAMRLYLETFRPLLLTDPAERAVWLDRFGRPLTPGEFYRVVTGATKRQLGRAVNPHLFRHCLLTTLASLSPAAVRVGAELLGNADGATVRRHYDMSRTAAASRVASEVLRAYAGEPVQATGRGKCFPKRIVEG
jgi:site-specific recombinase XerD